MKKSVLVGLSIIVVAVSGCSSGVTIIKPVDANSKFGIVEFADCDQSKNSSLNCEGSGKKVSEVYGEVFGAPIVLQSDASKFDVLLTGKIIEYNEAVPMAFRPNFSHVALKLVDKNNIVLATQEKIEGEGNLFGSAKGCSKKLAQTLKSELGR